MSAIYTPIGHYVAVTGIAECITERLADTIGGIPNRVCIYPGDVAWDSCECGMLALTTTRMYGSGSFPTLNADFVIDCGVPYMVASLEITMLRCIPSLQEGKRPPSCEQLGHATRIQYEDAYAVWQGTLCCLKALRDNNFIQEFAMGAQVFTGPQGLCGGSVLTVDLGYLSGCC